MPGAASLIAELPPHARELGPDGIPVRDRMILDWLYAGMAPLYDWAQIVSSGPQGVLRIMVGCDALKVGDESDSVRVNLCQLAAQEFCDRMDCVLLTPKLNDLRWLAAGARPLPSTINPYPADTTEAMVQHSRMIDAKVPEGLSPNIIRGNVGKGSVNSTLLWNPPLPAKACIYGWHGGPGASEPAIVKDAGLVIQAESTKHVAYFEDYSDTVVVMRREAEFTDDRSSSIVDVAELAKDPVLSALVSHSGPVILRHPAIGCPSPEAGNGELPPACPVPEGTGPGPAPTPPAEKAVSNYAIAAGGVALGLAVAYAATR